MCIKGVDGEMCNTAHDIEEAFLHYYKELLGTCQSTSHAHVLTVRTGPLITQEHTNILMAPVTPDEIKECIFSIPSIKSHGPDDYSSQFFKDSWDIVGAEVVQAIQNFFQTGQLLRKATSPKCMITIDLKKAYDSMEWNFMRQMLNALKFPKFFFKGFSTFSSASGLTLNKDKSDIYFNGVSADTIVNIIHVSSFHRGSMPFRYLGVPISAKKLTKNEGMKVINRISASIRGWGVRNYLWGGDANYRRAPNISWGTCCLPKDEGGLGIKDAKNWNKALIGKYAWWLTTKKDHL
ncbi:uncharacterized protein LOC141601292 [Silene latifolia]|uniref:uncharacterized protein LOC141601292 n=1 Tax=Silene latifolia TaxID=37657 RepID=UPI003D7864F6